MSVIHLFRPSALMRAASAGVMPPIPPSPPITQGLHRTRSGRSSAFRCLRCYRTHIIELYLKQYGKAIEEALDMFKDLDKELFDHDKIKNID